MTSRQKASMMFTGPLAFLSNFAGGFDMTYGGVVYPTAEHFYQAMKTTDQTERVKVANAVNARQAKYFGRQITLRPDWEQIKDDVMMYALRYKFSKQPFRSMLIKTGDKELVETNWWHDNYWGRCMCYKCWQHKRPHFNKLGIMLMQIRKEVS